MDLNICISNGTVSTKIYDKRDDFDFELVNFPFLDGDVPPAYLIRGIHISLDSSEILQILVTLTAVVKPLLPNFLGRAVVILNFVRRFRNFIADSALVETYSVSLKTLLRQGISEPEFYGDLVYKFRKK